MTVAKVITHHFPGQVCGVPSEGGRAKHTIWRYPTIGFPASRAHLAMSHIRPHTLHDWTSCWCRPTIRAAVRTLP